MRAPRIPRETELTPMQVAFSLLLGLALLGILWIAAATAMSWALGAA